MAKKKLLLAAMMIGAFAMLLLYLYAIQNLERERNFLRGQVQVVKAATDLPPGTPLQSSNVTSEMVPQRFLPPNTLLYADLDLYLGQTTGQSIEEGTMVLVSDFQVEDVSNTLASKIPVGERAMALAVNNIAGVSGLLKPGDRVDILGTFPVGTKTELIQDGRGGESVGYVTMTLLQNVSLLATGQKISSAKSKGNRRQGGYSAVTLSVTIEEAELLTIAQTRGKMSLLLRHREDVDITSIQKKTLREVLEQLEVIQEQRQVRNKTPSRRRSMQRQPKPCPEGQTRQKDGSCKVQIEIIDGSR